MIMRSKYRGKTRSIISFDGDMRATIFKDLDGHDYSLAWSTMDKIIGSGNLIPDDIFNKKHTPEMIWIFPNIRALSVVMCDLEKLKEYMDLGCTQEEIKDRDELVEVMRKEPLKDGLK